MRTTIPRFTQSLERISHGGKENPLLDKSKNQENMSIPSSKSVTDQFKNFSLSPPPKYSQPPSNFIQQNTIPPSSEPKKYSAQKPNPLPNKCYTTESVFYQFGDWTAKELKMKSRQEQIEFLAKYSGIGVKAAHIILEQIFSKKPEWAVVIGGSRVRGMAHQKSDIDLGLGAKDKISSTTNSAAVKMLSEIQKKLLDLSEFQPGMELILEKTKIFTGNKTANISEIESPEKFFGRRGRRNSPLHADEKEKPYFYPSGSLTFLSDNRIIINPPGLNSAEIKVEFAKIEKAELKNPAPHKPGKSSFQGMGSTQTDGKNLFGKTYSQPGFYKKNKIE